MTALRTQYVNLTSHADNADGTLTVTAIARRSGIMKYRSDSGDRFEFVPPDLIDARDDQGRPIMGMLAGAPNTLEHPAQVIRYSADSRKAVQVGKVSEEIHIYTDADGERSVKVRFDVSDAATIADIKSGRKTGVSLGYLCNVIREDGEYKGTPYTHRQAMPFTIDHLAIVANPRNPGALITRFDSDDIAVMAVEDARSSFEVIRVDACCSGCDGDSEDEPDEPKPKKKKAKTDAEDLVTVPIVFKEGSHNVGVDVANALWAGGVVDRIRMDGGEYFISADIAHGLAIEGLIHRDMGEVCGRGWKGTAGNCTRSVPNAIGHGIASAGRSIGRGLRIGGGKVVRFAKSETGQRIASTAVQVGTIAAVNHFRSKEVNRRKTYSDWQKNGGPRPGYKTIYEDD